MKWTTHINNTVARGKRLLGFLGRNLRRCGPDIRAKAYKTLVRPVMEYSGAIWDPHEANAIAQVEKVQRQAARFVKNKPHRRSAEDQVSVTSMIQDLGWPSLEERRKNFRLTMMFKIKQNLAAVPPEYHPKEVRGNTRSRTNKQLETIRCETEQYRMSFLPRTIRDFNVLHLDVRASPRLDVFKQRI